MWQQFCSRSIPEPLSNFIDYVAECASQHRAQHTLCSTRDIMGHVVLRCEHAMTLLGHVLVPQLATLLKQMLTCALLAQLPNDRLQWHKGVCHLSHALGKYSAAESMHLTMTALTCAMTTEVMAAHLHAMAYWTTCAPGV